MPRRRRITVGGLITAGAFSMARPSISAPSATIASCPTPAEDVGIHDESLSAVAPPGSISTPAVRSRARVGTIACEHTFEKQTQQGDTFMKKLLTTLAAGSALALVSVAAPTAAEARCIGCGVA